jgi:hypothetical protein
VIRALFLPRIAGVSQMRIEVVRVWSLSGPQLELGHGFTCGFAAGFGNVSIQEETDYSTNAEQCDGWGHATRKDDMTDKKDGLHFAWGSNKKLTDNPGPKIFYNY